MEIRQIEDGFLASIWTASNSVIYATFLLQVCPNDWILQPLQKNVWNNDKNSEDCSFFSNDVQYGFRHFNHLFYKLITNYFDKIALN